MGTVKTPMNSDEINYDKIDGDLSDLIDELISNSNHVENLPLFTSKLISAVKVAMNDETIIESITYITRYKKPEPTVYELLREVGWLLEGKAHISIDSILSMLPENRWGYNYSEAKCDVLLFTNNSTLLDEINLLINKTGLMNTVKVFRVLNYLKNL